MENIIELLKENGLNLGRMISFSKGDYVQKNPHSVVAFNGNIISLTHGKVWWGDIDLTLDGYKIKTISENIGETLYVLKESDCFYVNENTDYYQLVNKAIWNTSQEIPFK